MTLFFWLTKPFFRSEKYVDCRLHRSLHSNNKDSLEVANRRISVVSMVIMSKKRIEWKEVWFIFSRERRKIKIIDRKMNGSLCYFSLKDE